MRLIADESIAAAERLKAQFVDHYGRTRESVQYIRAPYRICPLGAHIDHQLGPVSAIAANQGIGLAFAANDSGGIEIVSDGYPGMIRIDLSEPLQRQMDWADYARGALRALQQQHEVRRGVSLLIRGHLSEAGISSSAAVGLGYLLAIATANDLRLDDADLIELDRVIENDFLGLKNGVLDQSAIALSRKGQLSIIDCQDLSCRYVSQAEPFTLLAVYSGIREALINSSKFNNRVEECLQAGARLLHLARGEEKPESPLGALSAEEWQQHAAQLPDHLRRRAEHFFSECARVRAGANAWAQSDPVHFGELMRASGMSSIHNYETGSPEMIRLFEILNECQGVYGARFSGAGFRGCAIALIEPEQAESICEEVAQRYLNDFPQFSDAMWAFTSQACDGLSLT